MGRNTDFFILHKEIARAELYPVISSDRFAESFKEFLIRRKKICDDDYDVHYESISQKVSTDINNILPSELFELIYWLGEIGYNYEGKGIEELFNLHGTTAYSFMFQYGNFTDYYPLDALSEAWSGERIHPKDFMRFLDYMILLMGRVSASQIAGPEYSLSDAEKEYIDALQETYKDEKLLWEIIDAEFEYLKRELVTYIESGSKSKVSPEVNCVYWSSGFLDSCIEMKSRIAETGTMVFIVDSL
ncbi:hypothetical protein [Flavobacterium fluviale]|uniref:Uncharacterized protein n=1 Tax=Flavobacterium fluviale TaxID=2249356 RepID=A0A344LW33_9FLAO|nr:hypothetical protein [Flavobacterium fluviale]AXB58125.1 hypothetical protein HYN86_16615 [Flavobacterium fluviale]